MFNLSVKGKYGLLAVIELERYQQEGPIQIKSIAEAFDKKMFFNRYDTGGYHKEGDVVLKYWYKVFNIEQLVMPITKDLGIEDLYTKPRFSYQFPNSTLSEHIDQDRIVGINGSIAFYNWRVKNKRLDDKTIELNDASVDLFKFISLVTFFLRDSLYLVIQTRSWDSVFFFMQFRQIIARYCYEAFFSKFQAKSFFVMDDYAKEHIVRSMVLRKLGIKSVSMNHGLPFRINQAAIWKYVDYDIYYVYGLFIYEKYYQKTWSNNIDVKAVGSLRIPAEYYPKILLTNRSKDILFLWGKTEDIAYDTMLIEAIYCMADMFKDRKIYVRPKPTRIADNSADNLLNMLSSNPRENIVIEDKDLLGQYLTYELMINCMYAIGVGSTAVAESIQCGCISFFLDYDKRTEDVYYQNFPQLCVDNIDDTINRIKDIESGKYYYNFNKLSGLIDLSRVDPINSIRKDLGLN